ncbi:hypothetical protein HU200_063651 [Digitaria exilis]|uniref:Uncharacterized protein n=1 Tax=Digitaria exilis TaxID=1010633 RepID=A0A835DX30_9POAL|nr:hypothetical protein HU200_063655 [Digitaria exilis]KAF8650936.1 hypothetical protein HU200_063651 [Digitaria exilis]
MPNLASLRLEEIPRRNIHLVDVSSVEVASIYLDSLSFGNSQVDFSILSSLSNATILTLVSPSVFEDVVPKSGDDDYEILPNADAEIDPPCQEAVTTFSCKNLRKISIHCDPRGDKRAQIIVRIVSAHLCPLPEIKIKPLVTQD